MTRSRTFLIGVALTALADLCTCARRHRRRLDEPEVISDAVSDQLVYPNATGMRPLSRILGTSTE